MKLALASLIVGSAAAFQPHTALNAVPKSSSALDMKVRFVSITITISISNERKQPIWLLNYMYRSSAVPPSSNTIRSKRPSSFHKGHSRGLDTKSAHLVPSFCDDALGMSFSAKKDSSWPIGISAN